MQKVAIRNDGTLAYDVYDFTPPWLEAETVVLVPGFTKNRAFWYGWIPQLARHYRVVALDQRGHGDSSPLPPRFEMSVGEFADDLADFSERIGIRKAHYVMAEFSSAIALVFAATHPGLLHTLVLPGLIYHPGDSVDWEGWARIVDEHGSLAWARRTNDHRLPPDTDPLLREWYVTQQGRFDPTALAHFFRFVRHMDLRRYLPRVKTPTLVISGEHTRVESLEHVCQAVQAMPAATLKVLPGKPFNVMSAATQESVAATLDFLARHPMAAPAR